MKCFLLRFGTRQECNLPFLFSFVLACKTNDTKYCEDLEQQVVAFMLMGIQNGTATVVDNLAIYYKLQYCLTIWSSSCPLYHSQKLVGNLHPQNPQTWLCIATLFIIAKNWNHTRCLLIGEWIEKLELIHKTEYYSVF